MSGLPLALLVAVIAALSIGARQDPTTGKGTIVEVEIVFATHAANEGRCGKENVPARTVFVDLGEKKERHVHHCVGKKLIDHSLEKQDPKSFDQTLVRLSSGDSIRWTSKSPFRVTLIEKHAPMTPGSPAYPFTQPLQVTKKDEYFTSVLVGQVLNLDGNVEQRYKASFEVQGFGEVDPDLVCSM